jgi:hypothetical protein
VLNASVLSRGGAGDACWSLKYGLIGLWHEDESCASPCGDAPCESCNDGVPSGDADSMVRRQDPTDRALLLDVGQLPRDSGLLAISDSRISGHSVDTELSPS